MAKDYYKTLGIDKNASKDDISKAFKKLARKYHPDVNPGDKKAEEKFKELSEAYDVLSNPDKKKKYDQFGSDFEGFGGKGYSNTYNPFGQGQTRGAGGFEFEDLSDIFGDMFSGMGSQKKSRGFKSSFSQEPQAGKDMVFSMELTLLEAINGCEKNIRLNNGVTFKVKIPAGITEGNKIRLAGKGEPGIAGGSAGDLLIDPKILPHPFFKRDGNDIEMDLPITISEAIEGGRIRVPTIDGSVELKIPANSPSGKKMRLKGKGILNAKTGERGDQYITLQTVLPENLDGKTQEELVKLLKNKENDPRANFFK